MFDNDALRYKYLKEYLSTFNLPKDFITYITQPNNNPSQHDYHNSRHCYTVSINCILASQYYRLTDNDIIELVIASIFHDWGHSGGELSDSENIDMAVIAYSSSVATYKLYLDHQSIIRLIRATQYPHMPVFELKEQIIQDADLLQYLHEDALLWMESFNNETGWHNSPKDVAEFLQSQRFNTEWAQKQSQKAVERLLKPSEANNDTSFTER